MAWLNDFALGFTGQRPVFWKGQKIGFFTDLGQACGGAIQIYSDAPRNAPAAEWVTKDDLWRDVPLSAYCLANGITVTWLSTAETAALKANNPAVNLNFLPRESNANPSPIPSFSAPSQDQKLMLLAIAAVGVGLALSVLRR